MLLGFRQGLTASLAHWLRKIDAAQSDFCFGELDSKRVYQSKPPLRITSLNALYPLKEQLNSCNHHHRAKTH